MDCAHCIIQGDGSYAKGPVYTDAFAFPGSDMPATQLAWGCATQFSTSMFHPEAPLFIGMSWQPSSLYSQVRGAMVCRTAALHMMCAVRTAPACSILRRRSCSSACSGSRARYTARSVGGAGKSVLYC